MTTTWQCQNCQTINNKRNKWCVYCAYRLQRITPRPLALNEYDYDWVDEIVFERRAWKLDLLTEYYQSNRSGETMTPQEELFSKLFNHEKILVKDMDTLTLRAHREELAKIAFEARARLTAVDDEDKERSKVKRDGKPSGFSRSVGQDSISSEVINTIRDRSKRMTKEEKLRKNLEDLFMNSGDSQAEAVRKALEMTTNSKINARRDGQIPDAAKATPAVISVTDNTPRPIFNPFEKK